MTLHQQDAHKLRAQIAGWLAVEGDPYIADSLAAGMPSERGKPVSVPRRQRKRSLAKVCEAARKAGADRVIVDGVVIALSTAAAPKSTTNEWDVVLPEDDHGAR
jgi:hypothetical protein